MAPYHFLPGFRVRLTERPDYDHWQGGKAYHKGAICTVCDRPLLLLWDLDCRDPRFFLNGSPVFGSLARLPFYYCWTCCAEMDYCVAAANRIVVLKNEGTFQGEDFPYQRFPLQFKRQPIGLDKLADVPDELKKSLSISWTDRVPARAKKPLEKWLGRRVNSGFDIWWHQLGGVPWLVQGPERILCPNEECSWSRRGRRMKVLGVILNDPPSGLPMVETLRKVERNNGSFDNYVQVVFHICKGCLTIHAANRCD